MFIVHGLRKSQIMSQGYHRYSELEYNSNVQSYYLKNNSFNKERYEHDYIHDDCVIDDNDNNK